ncbi:UNVERIFIED_CONTAM: Argininosuccinate lyase, chloroplastic [Sesamum radiatum]|uniref:Argininosuccinate lyase, chloroplastic n=1 Tax=Sesamum radiatum TaxID=300843 RepID=A0AAW2PJF7_SESRA
MGRVRGRVQWGGVGAGPERGGDRTRNPPQTRPGPEKGCPKPAPSGTGLGRIFQVRVEIAISNHVFFPLFFSRRLLNTHVLRRELLRPPSDSATHFLRFSDEFSSVHLTGLNFSAAAVFTSFIVTFHQFRETTLFLVGTSIGANILEDKEPVFDSVKTIMGMLEVSAEFADNITFNQERIQNALPAGHLDATTLADYLVKKGIPFRTSHDIVGRSVAFCVSRKCQLQDLSLAELRSISAYLMRTCTSFLESKMQSKSSVHIDPQVQNVYPVNLITGPLS